jgi:hypothetical protein
MTCSKKIRRETGWSSTWVRENSACQEKRAEVDVHRVHVEVIDHTRGLHNPRIRTPVGVTAFLGAEQHRLLLQPAR